MNTELEAAELRIKVLEQAIEGNSFGRDVWEQDRVENKYTQASHGIARLLGWEAAIVFEHLRSLSHNLRRDLKVDGDGVVWLYRSDEDIAQHLFCHITKIARVRSRLVEAGFVATKRMSSPRANNAMHYTITWESVGAALLPGIPTMQNAMLENPNNAKCNVPTMQNAMLEPKIPTPNKNKETKHKPQTRPEKKLNPTTVLENEDRNPTGKNKTTVPPPLMDIPGLESIQSDRGGTKEEQTNLQVGGNSEAMLELFEQALRGELKMKVPQTSTALQDIFLHRWCTLWGKRKTKVTGTREAAWRAILKNHTVQDFAEAMIGMAYDPWKDRRHHCDWKYLQRDMGQWLDLYEKNKGRPLPAHIVITGKTKTIKDTVVPDDYAWKATDDQAAQMGYKFNLKTKKWETP